MNERKQIGIINVVLIALFIIVVIFFGYNYARFPSIYQSYEKNYLASVEAKIEAALKEPSEQKIIESIEKVKEEYPLEIIIEKNGVTLYQTLPYQNIMTLLGSLDKEVIISEAHGIVEHSDVEVWYAIYKMGDQSFINQYLRNQIIIEAILFLIIIIIVFILSRTLLKTLRRVKSSVHGMENYDFDQVTTADDEINKSLYNFAGKLKNSIHVVSRKHTQLEQSLQTERQRLNTTITVSRSLIHDLKTPIHQNLIENELALTNRSTVSKEELAQKNMDNSDYVLKSINSILGMLRGDLSEIVKDKEIVNLEEIYGETLRVFRNQLRQRKLGIDFEYDEDTRIYSNYASIKLLVHNLVSNMVQYATEGSTLLIQIETQEGEVIITHRNVASEENKQRMKKSEQLFYVIEEAGENIYSSGNGFHIIKDLTEILGGFYLLDVHLIDQVEVVIHLPKEGQEYE